MRPYVICHMVSSVDGRIWGSRWRPKANIVPNLFETLHDQMGGGSWLCGRVTAQEFAKGKGQVYPPTDQKFPRENWFAQREAKAWGIFLDAHGKAVWQRSDIGGDPILVILTEQVPDSHLAGLRADGVSYIFAGKTEIDLAAALETLNRELGIERLMLEGGGGANGALLRAGLVDEVSLVITRRDRRQHRRADRVQFRRHRSRSRADREHDAHQPRGAGERRGLAALQAD